MAKNPSGGKLCTNSGNKGNSNHKDHTTGGYKTREEKEKRKQLDNLDLHDRTWFKHSTDLIFVKGSVGIMGKDEFVAYRKKFVGEFC